MMHNSTSCGIAEEAVFVVYRKTIKIINVLIFKTMHICWNIAVQVSSFYNDLLDVYIPQT